MLRFFRPVLIWLGWMQPQKPKRPSNRNDAINTRYFDALNELHERIPVVGYVPLDGVAFCNNHSIDHKFIRYLLELGALERIGNKRNYRYRRTEVFYTITPASIRQYAVRVRQLDKTSDNVPTP